MPKIMLSEEWVDDEAIYMERVDDNTEEDANIFEVSQAEFELLYTAKKLNDLVDEYLKNKIRSRLLELDFPGDTYDMADAKEVPMFTFDQVIRQCFTEPMTKVEVK